MKKMSRISAISAIMLCLLPAFLKAVPTYYYVATTGSDSNPGTVAQPFATIQKARDVVRTVAPSMSDNIYVYIRGGQYYLPSKVTFTEADSGMNGYTIQYQSYPGEDAEFIGGTRLTSWTADTGGVYKAAIATPAYTLFENGVRSTIARLPATGFYSTVATYPSGAPTAAEPPDPFLSIEAEAFDPASSSSTVNPPGITFAAALVSPLQRIITNITSSAVIAYKGVDFRSVGATQFTLVAGVAAATAGNQVEVRLGSATGTLIGTLTLASTGGATIYQPQSCSVSGATGVQDVYLVCKGLNAWTANFDWFYFTPGSGNDRAPTEAESYSSSSGVTTEAGGSGTVVASCDNNDYVGFSNVSFGSEPVSKIFCQLSAPAGSQDMKVQVRIGSLASVPVATFTLTNPSGATTLYKTYSALVKNVAAGNQTVYFTFRGGSGICKFDWFKVRPVLEATRFYYNTADLPSAYDYSQAQVGIWSGPKSYHYYNEIIPAASVVTSPRNEVRLSSPAIYTLGSGSSTNTANYANNSIQYWVQNARAFVTTPGTYFMDAAAGYLYYYPRKTPITSQVIIAGTPTRMFELAGSSESARVHHIAFVGLKCNITNDGTTSSSMQLNGLFYLGNADHITIKFCRLLNAGVNGITMAGYAQSNVVYGNQISGAGFMSVFINGPSVNSGSYTSTSAAYVNKLNVISNNVISDAGQIRRDGNGVWVIQSGENEISYNSISRMPKYGVSWQGQTYVTFSHLNVWGSDVTALNYLDYLFARDNTVMYNDMFNCMSDVNDSGVVTTGGTGLGNVMHHNVLHDTLNVVSDPTLVAAIYLDADTAGIDVDQNIVYNVQSAGTNATTVTTGMIFKGPSNTVTNNVFAGIAGYDATHVLHTPIWPTNDGVITNNIFTNAAPTKNNVYNFSHYIYWDNGIITTSNNNVWYNTTAPSGSYLVPYAGGGSSTTTFATWQALGYDTSSVTGSDPLFVDTAHNNYSVQAGSPAISRGFTNISTSSVGLKADYPFLPGTSFYESFENGMFQWSAFAGTPQTSTSLARTGAYSYVMNADSTMTYRHFTNGLNKVAVVYMYDDATKTNVKYQANVDDGISVALGVDCTISTTNYVHRLNNTYTATSVARSTGWHQLVWDYRSGTDVKLYIDGQLVLTTSSRWYFQQILLGDPWVDGKTATNCAFDDVAIVDELPFVTFNDGFEAGFKNWITVAGVPLSVGTTIHGGIASFQLFKNSVKHEMGGGQNKTVTAWLYDDYSAPAAVTSGLVHADNGTTLIGLGVNSATSTSKYVYQNGGAYTATTINRSTGWHQLTWDFTNGTNCRLYIDGTLVATLTSLTSFNQIRLGDYTANGNTARILVDDITVY